MNILILVSSLDMGGAQKQAVVDANMLAPSHKITLGMFDSGETGGALREMLDGRVEVAIFRKTNYISTAVRLARFLREQEVQVVHCHLYAPMLTAGLASLMARVPVIWHFHGHHFEVRKLPLNLLSLLPTVKKIIFVSSMLSRYFEKNFWFPKNKMAVVYNSSQSKKQPLLKGKDEPLRIGFVGRLVGLKRVQYLINLAAWLKERQFMDFEIWVIGDGPERKALEELAGSKEVNEQVKFLGFRTDVENLYNQLDLFILPSEEEALSLALIDAHNCGLPCIAFDVGGNKEIVQDGETGYIVHSETELQQKALELCRNKELRLQLGANAEEYAKIFSEQNHLQNLLNIYTRYA
ncbi:glycosyltransferase family 4 protein [Nafulsella turpanensis]|uniref:glycosyltransferase family 4 protein n=1 Tax=Nafulsella turpanensis TaxID=1265690 RepID=UPI000348548A|nr:glycosyltransferase family 4 protein [Nafulsella turpanensis]